MTGEMFALLASARRCVTGSTRPGTEALAGPAVAPAALFSIRARSLLAPISPGAGRARLSGLPIGAELAASDADALRGRRFALVADDRLGARYAAALAKAGLQAERVGLRERL